MTIPEVNHITEQIRAVTRKQKAKLLVVDDEPDNLDLLYRTFRREFQVLRANNGVEALEVLATEGEVAVIISDQRMPEMKGTEFLSRTVPQFPNTVRIILTGFTDVEDLVEAINAGQVYRYITKPWDPAELQNVVLKAAEQYTVTNNRIDELEHNKKQTQLLSTLFNLCSLEESVPDLLNQSTEKIRESLNADACYIEIIKAGVCEGMVGKSTTSGELATAVTIPAGDPLRAQAIASAESQVWVHTRQTPPPEGLEYYTENKIKQHLLFPLVYRGEILAFLSLQWLNAYALRDSDLELLHLAGQQLAFALISQKAC